MPLGFPSQTISADGTPLVLAGEEVCFAGEAIALVIAESRYVAEDAAALVDIEFEPLPVVADARAALDAATPLVRLNAKSNILDRFRVSYGDSAAAFAGAAHVFSERIWQHRGGAHPMEGARGACQAGCRHGELDRVVLNANGA